MKIFQVLVPLLFIMVGCSSAEKNTEDSTKPQKPAQDVTRFSDVNWEMLNPSRGDKSPKAATLWGDRKGSVPSGFLVKFTDGFSSPPHIHNVSYRGVVISGLVHNDDPMAKKMWMPPGSYWTQPKGEEHITAAKGKTNIAYIEIDKGPYLVQPKSQAFDSGERPVNIDKSNIVWLDFPGSVNVNGQPKIAYLWGNPHSKDLRGVLVKLPKGYKGELTSFGQIFRAVIISGKLEYKSAVKGELISLEAGSYFGSKGNTIHSIASGLKGESVFYVRSNDKFILQSK